MYELWEFNKAYIGSVSSGEFYIEHRPPGSVGLVLPHLPQCEMNAENKNCKK